MATISLLTGRPEPAFTIMSSPNKSYKTTSNAPIKSASSSPFLRPRHLRRVSSHSTGWYLDADTPSLKDFKERAQTPVKRLEKFANRCATNVVMGLMSPAVVVLFVFNPITIALMVLAFFAILGGQS